MGQCFAMVLFVQKRIQCLTKSRFSVPGSEIVCLPPVTVGISDAFKLNDSSLSFESSDAKIEPAILQ